MGLILRFVEWCQRPEMVKGNTLKVNRRVVAGLFVIFIVSMVSIVGGGFLAQAIPTMVVPPSFFININSANASAPSAVQWTVTIGGGGNQVSEWDIRQTADGGYILAGETCKTGQEPDILVVRMDSEGRQLWNLTYNALGYDSGRNVVQMAGGDFVVMGLTSPPEDSPDSYNTDIILLRINATGGMVWARIIGGPDSDYGNYLVETKDGFLILGATHTYHILLMKVDGSGEELWNTTYLVSEVEGPGRGFYVTQEANGSFTMVGDFKWSEGLMIKTDPSGSALWNRTILGCGETYKGQVAATKDGGFALLGYVAPEGSSLGDMILTKLSTSGQEVWRRDLGWNQRPGSLDTTLEGGYVLTSTWYKIGKTELYLAKLDPSGALVWDRSFGGGGSYYAGTIRQTSDYGYIVAGQVYSTESNPSGEWDIVVAKLAPDQTMDRTPPALLSLAPLNNSVVFTNDVELSASFSDDLGVNVASVVLTVDGQDVTGSASITTNNVSCVMKLENSAHTAGIIISDKFGNTVSAEWSFTVSVSRATEYLALGGVGATAVCLCLFLYMRRITR